MNQPDSSLQEFFSSGARCIPEFTSGYSFLFFQILQDVSVVNIWNKYREIQPLVQLVEHGSGSCPAQQCYRSTFVGRIIRCLSQILWSVGLTWRIRRFTVYLKHPCFCEVSYSGFHRLFSIWPLWCLQIQCYSHILRGRCASNTVCAELRVTLSLKSAFRIQIWSRDFKMQLSWRESIHGSFSWRFLIFYTGVINQFHSSPLISPKITWYSFFIQPLM